jgi:dTDP-4-dehydrorhamnose reductase
VNRNTRVLILGSEGQLGRELQSAFAETGTLICINREQVDLADESQVRSAIRQSQPELILNAAAYTAVDRAESEPDIAEAVNARLPELLAEESVRLDALLVHYSTDYVFDGSKDAPWTEEDIPNPLNVYGQTKAAGEQAVKRAAGKHLIFRTSWVYGPHGNNFLFTMLRLGRERDQIRIVDDQLGAPTTSMSLARGTHAVVSGALDGKFGSAADWAGLYHMTCSGATSWCGFARQIFADGKNLLAGRSPEVVAIRTSDYPTPARRPLHSVLLNARLKARFGVELPHWREGLNETLSAMARSQSA